MRYIDEVEVRRRLTYEVCMPLVREAMIKLSRGETMQHLRTILPMSDGRRLGMMPGALGPRAPFGAKLISVFDGNFEKGIQSHQGLVILFDPETGAPVCTVHAGEVTAIRTAAASAVATDALARKDATTMALLGYGEQAGTHARAIAKVRKLKAMTVWGRSLTRAQAFAERMEAELGIPFRACATVREAVAEADIVSAVSSAAEPILMAGDVRAGTHINAVGSSHAGPSEIDVELVARARFIADYRAGVLVQGAEFLRAKAAGLVDDGHMVGEIGEVLDGSVVGRRSEGEITIYKSLGHVVQDLTCGWALYAGEES